MNVCVRRAQRPSLLGICRTAAEYLLKTNNYSWPSQIDRINSNIIENFAQVISSEDKTLRHAQGKQVKEIVVWPRYHQLDAVRTLLNVTKMLNIGRRSLIQHSAGSGKSNSITWLAYQLVTLLQQNQEPFFYSIIVVTDRVNLDKQVRDNINAFQRLSNLVGWADKSGTLRELLTGGKKIIISVVIINLKR